MPRGTKGSVLSGSCGKSSANLTWPRALVTGGKRARSNHGPNAAVEVLCTHTRDESGCFRTRGCRSTRRFQNARL